MGGVQVIVFILRSKWEYMWWFAIYFTVGLPVFYLVLPTYSFWNMDDFSWGKTRSLGGAGAANAEDADKDDADDKLKLLEDKFNDVPGADRSTTSSKNSSDQSNSYNSDEDEDSYDDERTYESGSKYTNRDDGSAYESEGNNSDRDKASVYESHSDRIYESDS